MKDDKIISIRNTRKTSENTELSDEAVAIACGTRDPAAINLLFDRFHNRVARYIYSLNGPDNVEDLVQSTFVEVIRGGTVYDGRASVTTWLFAIATNIVRHQRRSYSRKARLKYALQNQIPETIQTVDDTVENEMKVQKANRAMQLLQDSQREAFVLCVIEGLSAKQAAKILNTSESAVWKRVCKAKAFIRRRISEDI